MITCTSTVHHGDTHLTATGTGPTHTEAFAAAVDAMDVGYRPSPENREGGLRLLRQHQSGVVEVERQSNYAYYDTDLDGQPRIQIGWVDFTFTAARPVKLWAISAQVEVNSFAWSGSRQVPTFYLDPSVQGIVNEAYAIRIAEEIPSTAGSVNDSTVKLHVTAEPVY